MKNPITKSKQRTDSARRLTLCRRPGSVCLPFPCKEGLGIASRLLGHLQCLARNGNSLSQITGLVLGCQESGWEIGALGPGQEQESVAEVEPHQILGRMRVTFLERSETTAPQPSADAFSELCAAISGIFQIALSQCHKTRGLSDSSDMYKVVLHAISDVAFLTDGDGTITYVCPNADGFCGHSLAEIKKIPTIFDILGSGSACLQVMHDGHPLRNQRVKLVAKNGSEAAMLVDAIKTSLPLSPYLFTFRDVTELTKSQEDLREANARLEQASQSLTEKNVALREMLYQMGLERSNIQNEFRSDLETSLRPLLEALKAHVPSSLQPMLASAEHALDAIVTKQGPKHERITDLTHRELQIYNMVVSGFSSKEIAGALNIAPATVVNIRKNVRKKLGISGQPLALAAHGLVQHQQ